MNTFKRTTQSGLTLIELMIAMTLSLLVAAAMIMLFANSKETYRLNENMARLQENGRFAMQLLSSDLRWTDYRACTLDIVPLLPTALAGVNNASPTGTDRVTITYQLDECPNPGAFVLPSPPTTRTTVFFLKASEIDNSRTSLYRTIDGDEVELVEGISDLQVLYGEDTDGDDIPNYYVDAGSVSNMERVVSVRFTVTAQTMIEQQSTGGNPVTRDFASTVVLRNRIP
ncbi:MAG: PilW family protein [Xanthomonadales bacterium]|nr:PilW family protein [Xanthomonadales bacterium]